ncbi:MAG: hypothetical protein K6B65_03255 [Bacilli bacterium]|nr:hypothetical protein [Bacilli bacterium]
MVEESHHTPMQLEDVCSEGGRFGVYCKLIELAAEKIYFPMEDEPGFKMIFPLLFALLPNIHTNPDFLDNVPKWAIECYDKHSVTSEDDILYKFPEGMLTEEDARLNMALLYIALEFGLSRKEDSLQHLSYLFSSIDNIRPYVKEGYALSPLAKPIEAEVQEDLNHRLPEDLYSALNGVKNQIHDLRDYYASRI